MIVNCKICDKSVEVPDLVISGIDCNAVLKAFVCEGDCESANSKQVAAEHCKRLYNATLHALPESNSSARLSDFQNYTLLANDKLKSNAVDKVKGWVNSKFWFFGLSGEVTGIGKTRLGLVLLSCLAAKGKTRTKLSQINKPHDIGYYKAGEINTMCKSELTNTYQPNIEMFQRIPVLMIDELTPRAEMPFKDSSMIEDIIEIREDKQRKTILTTNMSLVNFEKEYPRLYSRMRRGFFEMTGKDRRK